MTSRERFLRTFNGDRTDRIPVTYFIVDQGHFLASEYPSLDPHNYDAVHDKMLELYRQIGGDILFRACYGINPMYLQYGGLNVYRNPLDYSFDEGSENYIPPGEKTRFSLNENWDIETKCTRTDSSVVHDSIIRTPLGELSQQFTINEILPKTFLYGCTKKPVSTPKDVEIVRRYEPRIPSGYKELIRKKVDRLKGNIGNDGILSTWTPHGPFNIASLLIPEEDLYSLFLVDYEFYSSLMDLCIERTQDYVDALSEAGVDAHSIGANVAGGFLGRQSYDKFVMPFEKRYIDIVQSKGIPAIYHNCGHVMSLLESYIDVGPRIIEPFSPHPLGDGDIPKAKELLKDKAVIIGNLDQVNILKPGPLGVIEKKTVETVNQGKPRGNYIFQTADFIEYDTPAEHVSAMVDTAVDSGDL